MSTPAERFNDAAGEHVWNVEQMVAAFRLFALMAKSIPDVDVDRALEVISQAESIGHIIDPTKYRDALYSGSLRRQRAVVELFKKTKARLREIFPEGWEEPNADRT